jgi:hypothetical protein
MYGYEDMVSQEELGYQNGNDDFKPPIQWDMSFVSGQLYFQSHLLDAPLQALFTTPNFVRTASGN